MMWFSFKKLRWLGGTCKEPRLLRELWVGTGHGSQLMILEGV